MVTNKGEYWKSLEEFMGRPTPEEIKNKQRKPTEDEMYRSTSNKSSPHYWKKKKNDKRFRDKLTEHVES